MYQSCRWWVETQLSLDKFEKGEANFSDKYRQIPFKGVYMMF